MSANKYILVGPHNKVYSCSEGISVFASKEEAEEFLENEGESTMVNGSIDRPNLPIP